MVNTGPKQNVWCDDNMTHVLCVCGRRVTNKSFVRPAMKCCSACCLCSVALRSSAVRTGHRDSLLLSSVIRPLPEAPQRHVSELNVGIFDSVQMHKLIGTASIH